MSHFSGQPVVAAQPTSVTSDTTGVREHDERVDSHGPGEITRALVDYMSDCRRLVLEELARFIPRDRRSSRLYELVYDYPLREAKALRPALCIAVCRALGGKLGRVLPSAAVLELYHNAFLVHDDVEDGSERRRAAPTLHRVHGVPMAVNVGDAMLALALQPLIENTRILTLGKALRVLECVARMARESAEGQALELEMIRNGTWTLADRDYFRLVHKKTSHYSFIAPAAIGAIAAGAGESQLAALSRFCTWMGIAFQIQDDLLNLSGSEPKIGKEVDGDLWEGKHTLMLAHALRSASSDERSRADAILRKTRPSEDEQAATSRIDTLLERLQRASQITEGAAIELRRTLAETPRVSQQRTAEDVAFLKDLIVRSRGTQYARRTARRWAGHARRSLEGMRWLKPSVHRDFLFGLTDFVVDRDH
jgi:geranylgeranyl diphosphate synthase type II